ncbi:hypothetical protein IRB23SM22_10190 [Alkalibacterium sp. s-m-22]
MRPLFGTEYLKLKLHCDKNTTHKCLTLKNDTCDKKTSNSVAFSSIYPYN